MLPYVSLYFYALSLSPPLYHYLITFKLALFFLLLFFAYLCPTPTSPLQIKGPFFFNSARPVSVSILYNFMLRC